MFAYKILFLNNLNYFYESDSIITHKTVLHDYLKYELFFNMVFTIFFISY